MIKRCNSEYSRELIKNCKRGEWKNGVMLCKCKNDCRSCTAGSTKLPMHPELYAIWKLEGGTEAAGGSSPRGLKKAIKDRKMRKR